MLKTLVLGAGLLIAAVLLYAATRPDTFAVQRSTVIQAPAARIFPLINDLRAFETWSPYEKKDPAMKRVHSGPASGPGARYAWDGNSEVGAGSMQIASAAAPSKVTVDMHFLRPFEARNTIDFTLEPQGEATRVTWALRGPSPYVSKLMGLVFDMDKMIGRDFENGLANLKAAVEAAAKQ